MNKLRVNDTFHMGQIKCTITGITNHCGTNHYRFTWMHNSRPGVFEKQCGHMPVFFVDTMAGYVVKPAPLPHGPIPSQFRMIDEEQKPVMIGPDNKVAYL